MKTLDRHERMTVGWVLQELGSSARLEKLAGKGRPIPRDTAEVVKAYLARGVDGGQIPEVRPLQSEITRVKSWAAMQGTLSRQRRLQTLGLGTFGAGMLGVLASQGAPAGMSAASLAESVGGAALALMAGMWMTERRRDQAQQTLLGAQDLLVRLKVVELALSKKPERAELVSRELAPVFKPGPLESQFGIFQLLLSHLFQS